MFKIKFQMLYLSILCAALLTQISLTQDLKAESESFSLRDTTLAIEYIKIAESFSKAAQYDSSNYYLEKAKLIYEELINHFHIREIWIGYIRCLNEIGWNLIRKGEYDTAFKILSEALQFGLDKFDEATPEIAQTYNNMGHVFYYIGRYDIAIEMHTNSLKLRIQLFGGNNEHVASSYNNLGINEIEKGNYDIALEQLQKSLIIIQNVLGEEHIQTAYRYTNIGLVYTEKGDYDKALEYYKRSIALQLKLAGEENLSITTEYNNVGMIYNRMGDYDKALENYHRALVGAIKYLGERHPKVAYRLVNIGSVYLNKGLFKEALNNFHEALAILLNLFEESHNNVAQVYYYIGEVLTELGELDSALENAQKALSLNINIFGDKHPEIAKSYLQIAEIYKRKENFFEALDNCQKSIISLVAEYDDQSIFSNPPLKNIISELQFLEALRFKAKSLFKISVIYEADWLELSLVTYSFAIDLIDNIRFSYKSKGSKLFLSDQVSEIYDGAINVSLQLFDHMKESKYKEKAFLFVEKSKSAVLREGLNEVQAKQFSKLPPELLEVEKQLKIDLAFYDTRLQKEFSKKGNKDTILIKEYENLLFDLRVRYEELITKFEREFPDYYDLKYQTSNVSISDIQTKLNEETVLIEYFVGDNSIYIFIISGTEFDIISIEKPADFYETVKSFYTSIIKTEREEYILSGNKLSEMLIIPVLNNQYLTDKMKLVIIPDDILYKIPFEALFTSVQQTTQSDYSKFDYLLNDFDLSYHYSATLFINSQTQDKHKKKNFTGFAPVFPDNYISGYTLASDDLAYLANDSDELVRSVTIDGNKFNELIHSEWEVKTIVGLFKQERKETQSLGYFYSDATEDNFKTKISKFDIIHIATHSFINETHPQISGIVFAQPHTNQNSTEDGILYAGEIYNLDLNADLVVLSSCESGLGKLIKGEGLMALTRGFLYSGANNVIISLWKVPDKPTSELMVEFYRSILSDKNYSNSLREAKLGLIKNSSTARPRSWASFILIGGD